MKTTYLILTLLFFTITASSQSVVANFKADKTAGCSPLQINFSDQSSGVVTEWAWDFGNGGTSNKQNPSAIYVNPGSYTVTLTVKNASGVSNTITKTAFITIVNEPTVDFTSNKTVGCSPTSIQFIDQSVASSGTVISSWYWEFGDGGTSTQQNPSYNYKTPGSYSVSLRITNDKGCTKVITKPNIINISAGIGPIINYTMPDVCSAPATVSFSSNGTVGPGNLSYFWRFSNGTTSNLPNPTATYATNGNYPVTVIISSDAGCTDSISLNVNIGKANTDFIVPSPICPNTPVQFLNNSSPRPISAQWDFSNGTSDNRNNGQTTFTAPGSYTVRLINTYSACIDTIVKSISVAAPPSVDFSASNTSQCKPPLTVNFTTNATAGNYLWNFGDSTTSTAKNPVHNYTKYGDYTVSLTITGNNTCPVTVTKPGFVKVLKPVISFDGLPTNGCIPFDFNFKATVQSVDAVSTYLWDFGDGSPKSNLTTPTHSYPKQGTYNVSLTVTTSGGCTETATLPNAIKVGSKPTANFTATTNIACGDPGIQFNNLSSGAIEYSWEFSDGTTSNEVHPFHVFKDTGNITVTLNAINNGCEDAMIKKDFIYIKPSISRFDYRPNCNNKLEYSFTDKSLGATTWKWDFGDGTVFNGQNPPPHVYPSEGTYTVSLLTTNGSCSYTEKRTITIRDYIPDFTAPVTAGCKSFTPIFYPTVPDGGLIQSYLWDYGDSVERDAGQGSYGQFTYTNTGNYYVRLTTVDSFGCKHAISKNNFIRVNGPVAAFTSLNNTGCKGLTTEFIDSTINDGINQITRWTWDFGDGKIQTYTNDPFTHQYDSIGDYDVKLFVTDAAGCMDSITAREYVKTSVVKSDWYTKGEICPGAQLAFYDISKSDLPYTPLWNFGDGQTDNQKNTSHSYTDTGYYDVKLVVEDILGCKDSLNKTNAVKVGLPVASFTANNLDSYCQPFEAKFTSTSTFAEVFNWDLGIATSNQQHPTIYYNSPGTYNITLVAISPGGCRDTANATLQIHDPNTARVTYDPLLGCRPFPVNLEAFSPMNARYVWDFGDGNVIDTNINKLTHLYDNFGTFVPIVVLKEPDGCQVTLSGTETITINGAKAKFDVKTLFFCDSGYVNIIDSTTSRDRITRYTWDFGDGTISNNPVPVHNYTTPGLFPVSLLVETETGCRDSMLFKAPVKVVLSPQIGITGDSVICVNESVNVKGVFLRSDTSAVAWAWQFGNGNGATTQNPPPQKYTAGSYMINTVAINSSGCRDTASRNVRVNPLPVINATTPLTKVVGIPITIPVTYSSNIAKYNWLPPSGLNCTDCPQPVTNTKFTTDYVVSVIDSNNCVNAQKVTVIVLCKGAEIFIPNTFSPNGDGSNDIFYPRGRGIERIRSMRIFNRWGEVVHESREFPMNDAASGWNGRYKNGSPQAGVYVYQIELICENGEILNYKGNIALIL